MKTRLAIFGFLVTGWIGTNAQAVLESEVPGDNFSLEGALQLFKESSSPEEFERKLNSADSKVNNLDLNKDGYIDYIRVIDRAERNVHAFIIQAVLSDRESQDVAVIELEKLENGRAILQITGDADVYGMETIIEPTEEVYVNAGTTRARRVVNVWTWPSVQYVYRPHYLVYISPWYWSYRPYWWTPWRPVAYYEYDPWWRPYRSYYSVCHSHRVAYAQQIYRPYRTTSVIVNNYYGTQINNYRSRSDSGTRGRDRYSNQDVDQRNNAGSRSNSGGRTSSERNSEGRRRLVDNSEMRDGSSSSSFSRSNDQTRELVKTRSAQPTRSTRDIHQSIDRSDATERSTSWTQENARPSRSQEMSKPSRTQETQSRSQQTFERSSVDFKRSTERSTSQPSYESTRRTQPSSNGQSLNTSRSSQNSGTRSERISRPSGSNQTAPASRLEKTRVSRGKE
jgi:hypothetical protein